MSDPLEMTRDEALALLRGGDEGLEQWRQRREDHPRTPIDLSGVDLHGAELPHISFYGVNLEGADLSGANLAGSYFDELVRVNLDGATLCSAFLSGLTDCTLREADLSNARFSGTITRTDLTGAKFTRAHFSSARSEGVVFRDADLSGVSLRKSTLSHSVFDGANLSWGLSGWRRFQRRVLSWGRACQRKPHASEPHKRGSDRRGFDQGKPARSRSERRDC